LTEKKKKELTAKIEAETKIIGDVHHNKKKPNISDLEEIYNRHLNTKQQRINDLEEDLKKVQILLAETRSKYDNKSKRETERLYKKEEKRKKVREEQKKNKSN